MSGDLLKIYLAALLGAMGTFVIQLLFRYSDNKKKSRQVKYLLWESCRRVSVYLEAMQKESKEDAKQYLNARIKGIEVILKLLSEMQMNMIPTKDIFAMFRTREIIQEIIDDLKLFDENLQKVRQYQEDVNALINSNETIDKEVAYHIQRHKESTEQIDYDYNKLCKDIVDYIEKLKLVRTDYNQLQKGIYKINKKGI
ncbi:hypothetical protein AB1L12_19810 [Peribacillus frigoritolerans]|uniref:hypothetical protein n=1 Tax=Peribacillus frigoritolerans TaxID=450367 RepID=UPI0039A3B5C1